MSAFISRPTQLFKSQLLLHLKCLSVSSAAPNEPFCQSSRIGQLATSGTLGSGERAQVSSRRVT